MAFIMNALMFEIVEVVLGERVTDGLLLLFQQAGRPGVRDIGQEFDAGVTQRGDARDRFCDRVAEVGVGTEGEFHVGP